MIPLCPSRTVGSECSACGIYTAASDKLQLITGNFVKGAHRPAMQKHTDMPGWMGCSLTLLLLILQPTHPHTPSPRCGLITRGVTHLSESFKGFFFPLFPPSTPTIHSFQSCFSVVFFTALTITEERTVLGVTVWRGSDGDGGGGRVSIVTPRQWKDWTSGVCSGCQCVYMWFSSVALGWDTVEPFMIYYLAPSGLHS